MNRASLVKWGLVSALCLIAAILPAGLDIAFRFVAAIAGIYALSILSLVLLTGYVGQISLCQATFSGISAFVTGALASGHGWNYLLAALVGIASAFLLGLLVGIPALRLRGILLAIVTVGVALVFDFYFFQAGTLPWLTGGQSGWQIAGAQFLGVQLDSREHILPLYWIIFFSFVLVALLVVNMNRSGSGRRFRAIRDSELAAATMGVDLTRYKLLGFGVAAAIAGVAGAFYPIVYGSISAQPFSLFYSLQFAAFGVLMGIRYVPAAAIGGFFMAFVPELLQRIGNGIKYDWFNVALGGLLIAQLILAPDGVWGDIVHRARSRRLKHTMVEAEAPA